MTLELKKIEEDKFEIKFSDQILEISKDSEFWNTEGINKFLISLASKTPKNEMIDFVFDKEETNNVFIHIVDLFNSFVEEYNKLNVEL